MAVRVFLVDDHQIMREGLCTLLCRQASVEIVGQASDGRTAVEMACKLHPDVVIMDIGMPDLNGIEATHQMTAMYPDIRVIALSTYSDTSIVAKMLRAGARGYILKESTFTELANAISSVMENKHYLCTKTSRIVFADYVNNLTGPAAVKTDALSNRERQVLQLVAEGKTTKDIAAALNLSTKTVDSHREHIMTKLDIRNIAGLTKYAVREGLTTL